MILYFVLVGFVTGALGAAAVIGSGGGVVFALLAYSLAGAVGVLLSAVLVAIAPSFPRPRGGLSVGTGQVPVNARRVQVQAHASRR